MGFAVIRPLALVRTASHPVPVRRPAAALPASFSAFLAEGRLAVCLGSLRPGPPEDLHLLVTPMLGTQSG